MDTVMRNWTSVRGWARKAGPYLLLEALLPGGTLLALMLFLFRQRGRGNALPSIRHPTRAIASLAPRWLVGQRRMSRSARQRGDNARASAPA
jgi:hypothetical protein